jgi:hypothetical protein
MPPLLLFSGSIVSPILPNSKRDLRDQIMSHKPLMKSNHAQIAAKLGLSAISPS